MFGCNQWFYNWVDSLPEPLRERVITATLIIAPILLILLVIASVKFSERMEAKEQYKKWVK